MRRITILLAAVTASLSAFSQSAEDYTVELSAAVQETPAKITLQWKRLTADTPAYYIYKKAKNAVSWGTPLATLSAADSTYADLAVIKDSAYEYYVRAVGRFISTGYIYAGINEQAIHNRGTLILLVDSTFTDSCSAALTALMNDINGDGWQLVRHDVARNAADTTIRNIISSDYAKYPNVKSVLLVGHLAVPYSGDINPDGHPDHLGAWPADVYYSCITGTWTDAVVNDIAASYIPNQNAIGDGKWDQSVIPSTAMLQVSRIDFNNMPAFGTSEAAMMNSYLNRSHSYKMDALSITHRALINDNFGAFSGEAFAANGWRNFAPLVGRDSVAALPFISSLAASSYQWAYGCGPGSFTSAGGIGNTTDFVAGPVNGIFTMMFGSYFGDWNVQNSFLRAPLCASVPALTNCWAGRPNWFFHHMALGENIGYSARLAQNNSGGGLYQPTNYGTQFVHIALMGDLTLRTDYIKPAASIVATAIPNNGTNVTWTASADAEVIGYYIYRADSAYGFYKKISPMVTTLAFRDTVGVNGLKFYMVRPVKLQTTPSGKYYNLGIGIADTAMVRYKAVGVPYVAAKVVTTLFPNPATSSITLTITAENSGLATLIIVNAAGQTSHTAIKQINTGVNSFALNVSDLTPGTYMVVVKLDQITVTEKWIKL